MHYNSTTREERLLAQNGGPEGVQLESRESIPVVQRSLRSLDVKIFDSLKIESSKKGYEASQSAVFHLQGSVTRKYNHGFIVQKEPEGYFIVVNGRVRFVPDASYKGKISVTDNGKTISLREEVVSGEDKKPIKEEKKRSTQERFPQKSMENKVVTPDATTAEIVNRAVGYIERNDVLSSVGPNLRHFVRLYSSFWRSADPSGNIGKKLFGSPEYVSVESAIASNEFKEPSGELERKALEAIKTFVEAFIGPENDAAEKNAYVSEYNKVVRSRRGLSTAKIADEISNRTNGNPLYRSSHTKVMISYQKAMNDEYRKLATASEADAPAIARRYRAYSEAYRAISYSIRTKYEKKWDAAGRNYTMNDGKNRGVPEEKIVNAYFEKHRYIDALMVPDLGKANILPKRAERERADMLIKKYAPDYPEIF